MMLRGKAVLELHTGVASGGVRTNSSGETMLCGCRLGKRGEMSVPAIGGLMLLNAEWI